MRAMSPDMQRQLYDMLLDDTSRLARLVDQILVSSRLDRGIMMFDAIEDIELRKFLDDCSAKARHLDERLSERLTIDCPTDLVVRTCAAAWTLIVSNLIENAVKYSPKGSPIIVRAQCERGVLRISVQDRGLGLEKRDRKRVFGMFYRARIASKRAIPGTGLGLYIVASTAKILGGKVWAESPGRGRGSTFHVELPVRRIGEGGTNG
jgi:signal transduction histidine kinase